VDTNYVWVVPGIGFAADVMQYGPNPLGQAQPFTNYIRRAFLNPPASPPRAVSLALTQASAVLQWAASTNGGGYVVWNGTNVMTANWLPVAELTNLSLAVPRSMGMQPQFFRVTAQP
jgi:hypothetical protein